MTKPRNEQAFLEETSFYHCMVRCVRRAYLCGAEKYKNSKKIGHP
ncbi:hypothetical Protein YC6258_02138 [Gynuella sunshinyii YC6258]|uniref:Transposase n=1 Tax=Gynuella sunshinyii YC6258 TaxID=1445510 RepID=A0A0C5VIT4_9GAMM|nr:hypothetical Protein YC6258_02138 [Gynuella sunshinyii YC6258]